MREYPSQPWVGIGIVVHKEEEILLIKRRNPPNKNKWSLPGGAQHVGESIFEGAIRETFEETALKIEPQHFIDAVDSIHYDQQGKVQFHYTLIEVCALWVSGHANAGDDAVDACWVNIKEIEKFDLGEQTLRIIRSSYQILSNQRSRKASFTDE